MFVEPSTPSPSGIQAYLVRTLLAGSITRVGTVHTLKLSRGDTVVIDTELGEWLAEILAMESTVDVDPTGPISGELLRAATADDQKAAIQSEQIAEGLLDATIKNTINESITVVGTEVSLCGRVGIVRFLGAGEQQLGLDAVLLASRLQLQRVQWISATQDQGMAIDWSTTEESSSDSPSVLASPAVQPQIPEPALSYPDASFWKQFHRVAQSSCSLGSEHRVAAGNRGLYLQKIRPGVITNRRLPDGRCWMIRVRTVAGGIASSQFRQLLSIGEVFGDGTLRLTVRQAIQLHGVLPNTAVETIDRLHRAMLTTAGSCGNTVRNLTCCPLPARSRSERRLRSLANFLSRELLPSGPAFEFQTDFGEELQKGPNAWTSSLGVRPSRSLPHKWKIGLATAEHNCVDVLNNDLAIVLRDESPIHSSNIELVDLFVGGSTAYRTGKSASTPALAQWLGTLPVDALLPTIDRMLELFQQYSTVGPRHQQRWKYVVRKVGLDAIRTALQNTEQETSRLSFDPADKPRISSNSAHPPQLRQPCGRSAFVVTIPGGRIATRGSVGEALERLTELSLTIRVAPRHQLVIADVHPENQARVMGLVSEIQRCIGLRTYGSGPLHAVACPALPTCSLAVDEAETILDQWAGIVAKTAKQLGITPPELGISGCSNGCSRPLTTEIGLVAERPGQRRVFLGGNGNRLGKSLGLVDSESQFATLIADWLGRYVAHRHKGENFHDWFWRNDQS